MTTLRSTAGRMPIGWLCFCLCLVLAGSCKKSDPQPDTTVPTPTEGDDGGTPVAGAATGVPSALIYIPYDQPLDTGRIAGVLDGREVSLVFEPDSGLALHLPFDMAPGPALLTIPEIDGFEETVTVVQADRPEAGTVIDAAMVAATAQAQEAQAGAEGDSVTVLKQYVDGLNDFLQTATAEERERFAAFYHANSDWFGKVLSDVQADVDASTGGRDYRQPLTLMQSIAPQASTTSVVNRTDWQPALGVHNAYRLKTSAAAFRPLASRVDAIHYRDIPEMAAAMLMALQANEYTRAIVEAAITSTPVMYGVSMTDSVVYATGVNSMQGDQSVRTEGGGDFNMPFTQTVVGEMDTLYFGIGLRNIGDSDRKKSRENYPGIAAFFDGLDDYNEGVADLMFPIERLRSQDRRFRYTERPTSVRHYKSVDKRLMMPEWMIGQELTFNIPDRYYKVLHSETIGGAVALMLGYAEGHEPTPGGAIPTRLFPITFNYQDDFSNVRRSGLVQVRGRAPKSVEVTAAGDAPLRLSTAGGRTSVQLEAAVSPASALQQVNWEVIRGKEIVTIDENGLLKVNDSGLLGFVTVRASAPGHSEVYHDIDLKVTTYQLINLGGNNQTLPRGGTSNYPLLYTVNDLLDNECIPDLRGANAAEKLEVRMVSDFLTFNSSNVATFSQYYDDDGQPVPCVLANYPVGARNNREVPYSISIRVELLQDGKVIDTDIINAEVVY